jgi:hypothetical protein
MSGAGAPAAGSGSDIHGAGGSTAGPTDAWAGAPAALGAASGVPSAEPEARGGAVHVEAHPTTNSPTSVLAPHHQFLVLMSSPSRKVVAAATWRIAAPSPARSG